MRLRYAASTLFLCLLIGPVALAGTLSAPAPASRPSPDAAHQQRTSIPIIQLRGDGPAMGRQHGQMLNQPIHLLFDRFLAPIFGNNAQRLIAVVLAGRFESLLAPEHRAELTALADQVHIDPHEVMLGQCFLDLLPSMTACSTITLPADAAPDHVARFGRNLDFPSLGVADRHSVLFIYHPGDGRYAFAAVGWPGMIGVLSGMNQYGLALANMEVPRPRRLPTAMPYTLLYRTVLERCRTVDEAIALLQNTPRQSANNLMLMDAAGGRAVVEITPQSIHVRRADDAAALISTNDQRGDDADTPGWCDRYDYLHRTAAADFGRIDLRAMQDMLAHVAQGNMTLQSMIFEPANRVIYLATGADAPVHRFTRIDLGPLLAGH